MWMLSSVAGRYMLWFAVLVAGLGAFGVAISYARRPTEGKLAAMRPLSLASLFAALASLTGGWATVLQGAAATSNWTASAVGNLLMRAAETLIPVFTTFAILAVSWVIVTIGMRRHTAISSLDPAAD